MRERNQDLTRQLFRRVGGTSPYRRRPCADLPARFDHQLVVVAHAHEPLSGSLAHGLAPDWLIVQPVRSDWIRRRRAVATLVCAGVQLAEAA